MTRPGACRSSNTTNEGSEMARCRIGPLMLFSPLLGDISPRHTETAGRVAFCTGAESLLRQRRSLMTEVNTF